MTALSALKLQPDEPDSIRRPKLTAMLAHLLGLEQLNVVEVNLGAVPARSGSFTIASTGLTPGKPVRIAQTAGPYTGKGTLADEAEMDQVSVVASVTSASTITAYWVSQMPVIGNFKFIYQAGV